MSDSKKVPEFERLIQVADTVMVYCVLGSSDYHFLLSDLLTYIASGMFPEVATTCAANTTTNINLGAVANYKRFELQYIAKRGTKYRAGNLIVISDGSTVISQPIESPYGTIPNDEGETLGFTFTCDTNSGQARLNVVVNSDANDITFKHIVKAINV